MWIHIPISLEKVIKSLGIGNQHPVSWEVQEKGGMFSLTMHWTSGSGRHWTTPSAAVPVTTVSDGDNNSLSSGKSDSEKSTLPSGKTRRASVSSLLQTGGASRRPSVSVARLEKIRYEIIVY